MRGMLSLATAEAPLNVSSISSVSSTIVLDCGCSGWVTLITMAEDLLKAPSSSSSPLSSRKNHVEMPHRTVLARLPLMLLSSSASSSSSQLPAKQKQWACDSVVNVALNDDEDGELDRFDGGAKKLKRAMLRIREAFRYVPLSFSLSS